MTQVNCCLPVLVSIKIWLCRFVDNNRGKELKNKYSQESRRFAITLHFFSAKAYDFVRNEFSTTMPYLRRWYDRTNANPGFTNETLKILNSYYSMVYIQKGCSL